MKSNYFKQFLITLIFTLTFCSPAFSSNFASIIDIPENHWASPIVRQVMDEYELLEAFPDHTFRGEREFSRYEFVSVLSGFLNLLEKSGNVSLKLEAPPSHQFIDVDNSHWAYKMVYSVSNDYGILENLKGINEEKFSGNQTVIRNEIAEVLSNILTRAENKGIIIKIPADMSITENLTDLASTQSNFGAIKSIVDDYGIMIGFPDGTFRGEVPLNRYQFAAIMGKTMEVIRPLIVVATPSPKIVPTVEPSPSPLTSIPPLQEETVFFRENTPVHFDFMTSASTTTNKVVFIENLKLQFYPKPLTLVNSLHFSHSATDILGPSNAIDTVLGKDAGNEQFSLYGDEKLYIGYPFVLFKNLTLTPYIGGRILAIYRSTENLKYLEDAYGLHSGLLLNLVGYNKWHIYAEISQTNLFRQELWTLETSDSIKVNPFIDTIYSGSLGLDYYLNKNLALNAEAEVSQLGLPGKLKYDTLLYGIKVGVSF